MHVLAICSVVGIAACCTASVAPTPEVQDAHSPMDTLFTSGWSLGPEISLFHYEEPGSMDEDGVLYGAVFSSTRFTHATPSKNELFRFEGGIAAGLVDYDGALMDGTPYTVDGNTDVLANLRVLWGCLWHDDDHSDHLYGGIGYRYLGDDSSHDPAGYKRHSNYFYLPLGYKRGQRLGSHWFLGLGAEFDLLLYGLQRSDLFGDGYEPIKTPQKFGTGYGLRGSVALRHPDKTLDMSIEPFVQYWWVDDSEIDRGYYEPENNSTQIGLDVIFFF